MLTAWPASLYSRALFRSTSSRCPCLRHSAGHVLLVCHAGTSQPQLKHMFQLLNRLTGLGLCSWPWYEVVPPGVGGCVPNAARFRARYPLPL